MKKSLTLTISILIIPIFSYCQYITNYTLGAGYLYFKSNPKSVFINDMGLSKGSSDQNNKMKGNPFFVGNLRYDQLKEENSLVNILKRKNPNLANEYEDLLDKLSEYYSKGIKNEDNEMKRIFPYDWENNMSEFYRCSFWLVSLLEIYSEYYKDIQNVNIEMELEQNGLNEAYKKKIDSIESVQKQVFIKELDIESNKLSEIQSNSNKFQNKYNLIVDPIKKRYDSEIAILEKEEKLKINQLPPQNFSTNKALIQAKYNKLVTDKQNQKDKEINDIRDKFISDNEDEMKQYNSLVKTLTSNVSNLKMKIDNIDANVDSKLPLPTLIDQKKYDEKLEKIRLEAGNKIGSIQL